ncbi:glycosyltransferase family 39 protein [Rubrobacter calidifluminis]|uniref:glycosyltransferase family 39 protein n=1 Tax=Rubrobacter calidifluminis TaxID=1392640 RepID=UPI002362CC03|nr:glycosyltransferase family 39 protein [Rubrobacter calidifluminis]
MKPEKTLAGEAKTLLVLTAIVVLAAGLRLYHLGTQSLWGDELSSWRLSGHSVLEAVRGAFTDTQPPGYYVLLYLDKQIFGESGWALRLPSAVAGILSVPAVFLLGRRLYSDREGLAAALLAAVSWALVYYSQEVRAYSVLLFLSILTVYFWWGMLQELRTKGELPLPDTAGYVVSAVLCAYVHYFGLLLVILEGVAFLVLARRRVVRALVPYIPVALAYVPWLPFLAHQFTNNRGAVSWMPKPKADFFAQYLTFAFGGSLVIALIGWGLICYLPLGWWEHRRKERTGLQGPLLGAWLLAPFTATSVFSALSSTSLLTERNLIGSLPAAYLLVARALVRITSGPGRSFVRPAAVLCFGGLLLGELIFGVHYYTAPQKQQLREAVSYAVHASENHPRSLLAYCSSADLSYYLDHHPTARRTALDACRINPGVLRSMIRRGRYRYLVYLDDVHGRHSPHLSPGIRRNYVLLHEKLFYGGSPLYESVHVTGEFSKDRIVRKHGGPRVYVFRTLR